MLKNYFPQDQVQAAKRMVVRRHENKLKALVCTAIAAILALYFSGCESVEQRMLVFFLILFGPYCIELGVLLRPHWFPAALLALEARSSLLFWLVFAIPFWLLGVVLMGIF